MPQGSPQTLLPKCTALRLSPCQVRNTALGSSWGGLTALSSPSLKKHLKPLVRTNCGVKNGKRKEQGRLCQHWKAVAGGPTLLPEESHSAHGMQQLFFFKEKKKLTDQQYFLPNFPCSHKFHQLFTLICCLPHRKCSCLSLSFLLNNMLQILCK